MVFCFAGAKVRRFFETKEAFALKVAFVSTF